MLTLLKRVSHLKRKWMPRWNGLCSPQSLGLFNNVYWNAYLYFSRGVCLYDHRYFSNGTCMRRSCRISFAKTKSDMLQISGRMNRDTTIRKEIANHVGKDCTAKRGSNQGAAQGTCTRKRRGNPQRTAGAEAEKLTQAARYERNEQRQGYRSGHYNRNLTTTSGNVTLKVPKLKGISFETAIIERYRRRESSVEEALIEMYLAGVSVRRVEDITEALWGSKVSPSTISELNKKAYVHIEDWRNRPLQGGRYPYVYVDGIYLRRNWGGEFENVAILVAIAVNEDGYREVLGALRV